MAASTANEAKLPGGYLVTPRVPQGLAAAVEGLTREVIRHSPEDIYVFAAHHFEKLLVLREQCGGVEKHPDRDSNLRALREMSQALKMREMDRGNVRLTGNSVDQVGWSLNQTAKVLKRHRSIFGEAGRRISTDEVFRMASHKENHGLPAESPAEKTGSRVRGSTRKKSSEERAEDLWKASTSRTEGSWSNEDSVDKNEANRSTRSGPRIITQIPGLQSGGAGMLARDIKTELRKNRISSRERRSLRAKPEEAGRAIDRSEAKAAKYGSSRKSSDRLKRMEPEVCKKPSDGKADWTSSKDRRSDGEKGCRKNAGKLESRALSMDRVKDSVVQRFATAKSLEELQSVNYVERVQEIIDETGPIIKGKVDELKSGMIGRSKRSSWFAEARNDRARESNGSESGEHASPTESSRRPKTDALRSRLTETRCLMENVSSSLTRPMRRSRSARSSRRARSGATTREEFSDIDAGNDAEVSITDPSRDCLETSLSKTRNLLEDISSVISRPMRRSHSAKTLRRGEEVTTDDSSDLGPKGDALRTRLDETRNLLAGLSASFAAPTRRVGSARSSRNVDSEELSNSDPQSASKVSLPAVRSVSVRSSSGSASRSDSGNLVLPAISPEAPKSAKIKEDLVLPALSPPGTGSSNEDSKIGEATDDLLKELDIPEIPVEEALCAPEAELEDVFRDSLNVTPNLDSAPQRPDSLEPEETPEDVEKIGVDELGVKIRQIRDVENDTEEIFVSKSSNGPETHQVVGESNMRRKLQELEEAEKRIDRIFDKEVSNEVKDSSKSDGDVDEPVEIVGESDDRVESVGEGGIERALRNATERSDGNGQAEVEARERKMDRLSAVSPEHLEYTYVLTEGSPHDIPDTVTTVIIPDRTIRTPEFSEVNDWSKDSPGGKLSSLAESAMGKESAEEVEDVADDVLKDPRTDVSEDPGIEETTKTIESSKNIDRSNEELDIQSSGRGSTEEVENVVDELIEVPKTDDSDKPAIEEVENVVDELTEAPKSTDSDEAAMEEKSVEETTKTIKESSQDDRLNEEDSAKIESDIFGEFVKPEITEAASTDTEFILGMENTLHDMKMSHQDLGRIKEEMSEELEGLDDPPAKGSKSVGTIDGSKEEEVEGREEDDGKEVVVDESREKTESDLSPIASRPELDSVSSNEAKESSVLDEPLELAKCAMSLEEEASSPTRSPESSNEVKETTLTDALSLSLDPMRPYVPELNLDSLQDLTVSSFKMTEDEYENQGKAATGNTNSITDTLTSDENRRIIDSAEFAEEAIMEYLASSSGRSKVEETHEELDNGREEVVEEPVVKSQVEIEEDVCEKIGAYVTGSSKDEEKLATEERECFEAEQGEPEVKDDETKLPIRCEDDGKEVATGGTELSEAEQCAPLEKEDNEVDQVLEISPAPESSGTLGTKSTEEDKPQDSVESQSSTEAKALETATVEEIVDRSISADKATDRVESQSSTEAKASETAPSEEEADKAEDSVESQSSTEAKALETAPSEEEADKAEDSVESQSSTEVKAPETSPIEEVADKATDSVESQSSTEVKASETAPIEEVADGSISDDERKKEAKTENSATPENIEVVIAEEKENGRKDLPDEEMQNDVKSESPKMRNKEEGAKSGSPNASVEEADVSDTNVEVESTDEVNKSGDLECAPKSIEDGSDEILEENFVEEETPLAVSRSASQCTTRRVSSGNLARLREDPSLSWAEEVGPEATDEEDQTSAKVKFSKIGGETIKEQGSYEIDQSPCSEEIDVSPDSDGSKKVGNEINESPPKDSKEYHIYVPDVDAGDDNSTTDSSTVESAVTKIQARVRGFLTRRRVHRGQHNRSSTLGSIPSIQDSVAVDPEREEGREETGVCSSTAPEDRGLESAATRIQSNYRRYKARNRLRREDAVQRTTLSMEKSFAESGLQHTGEFHDCVPLPIHDLPLRKPSEILNAEAASGQTSGSMTSRSGTDKTSDSDSKTDAGNSDIKDERASPRSSDCEGSSENRHNVDLQTQNLEQMFFGQPSNVPIIKFDLSQNLGQIVDLVVLAKEEAALQSGYLNFITSVEDANGDDAPPEVPKNLMAQTEDEGNSNESLKEPLALSVTPMGVVIEEVTSSGAENFMRSGDPEATMASVGSSAAPEVATESLDSARAPCASSEGLSGSVDGPAVEDDVSDGPEVREVETRNSDAVRNADSESPEDEVVESEKTEVPSSSEGKVEDNLVPAAESTMEDFVASENFSLDQKKGLLGPESSVDSMECPVAPNEEKVPSESAGELAEKSAVRQTVGEPSAEEESMSGSREENPKDEEPSLTNADDSSSILSFSMKVQDFLGLGSEDSVKLHGRKPILEVTLSPGDLMKSMSTSQDSQLAGERIESPITMVQMAPERSESVQQEDLSDDGCEDEETNGKRTLGSSSEKSEKT